MQNRIHNICDGAKQIYRKNKKDSKEIYSANFSSWRPEVYSKKGVLKKIRHLFIGILINFMIFITFKSRDKKCSKIEKAWFLLLQWVAKGSKMNEKMFIFIYLSNN